MTTDKQQWLKQAEHVFEIEINALRAQQSCLNEAFTQAIACILGLQGRLVVVGMGKSGIIARKIAATFASTGTPAFFVHAAEAQHGDLGMITASDAVLALSHSGETDEVCGLLPTIKRLGATVIAITGKPQSTLATFADIVLEVPVKEEACPMNLAPTASTTATLALGDALAVVVLKQRGFREEDFARVHPAGSLGKKLITVEEVMHSGDALPMVNHSTCLKEAIMVMSQHRLGVTGVQDSKGNLMGCISDGDLRRILESGHVDLHVEVSSLAHTHPRTIEASHLASEAVRRMETYKVTTLFVTDTQLQVVGIVHLHDLLQAGIA
ncbi:MAG: KpsF/GutQ family sugar-phosphate isomerase [Zetaproteobacteria bacterium]|nr:KpsF/GutQ family sugar-phosphate isomerase [Zetaproteobacteria bacterium]